MLIPIRSDDSEKLAHDNIYNLLNNKGSNLINRYLEIDKIYFYAVTSDFPEEYNNQLLEIP